MAKKETRKPVVLPDEEGAEGIEEEMALEAYIAMQHAAGRAGQRAFEQLLAANKVMGVARVGRDMKEAFVLELRMRLLLTFQHQFGKTLPEFLAQKREEAKR